MCPRCLSENVDLQDRDVSVKYKGRMFVLMFALAVFLPMWDMGKAMG